jgi:hypothetical protein
LLGGHVKGRAKKGTVVGIRDLEFEKFLTKNSEGDILMQKVSKHLLDMVKAAYDLGWRDCAQQNKGSAEQQTNNIDYTAVLRVELSRLRLNGYFDNFTINLSDLSMRLNSAIKVSQNCA